MSLLMDFSSEGVSWGWLSKVDVDCQTSKEMAICLYIIFEGQQRLSDCALLLSAQYTRPCQGVCEELYTSTVNGIRAPNERYDCFTKASTSS
jgi:hypothetical protein